MARIQVDPGYTVEPRYIELADDELLCEDCYGRGQQVILYSQRQNIDGMCLRCGGAGKYRRCANCGKECPVIKHQTPAAWMDVLCIDCIVNDPRFIAKETTNNE